MGKAGRIACIFTPMALSLASLICLALVFLAGQNRGLSYLYFMKADTSRFTINPNFDPIPNSKIDDAVLAALRSSATSTKLDNVYQVYLTNYCAGKASDDLAFCSPRQSSFWFNPVDVWGLQNTQLQDHFPDELKKGLDVYQKIARWMFVAYSIALWTTVAEIVLGIFAVWSRWGSLATTVVSAASSFFTIAAAITSSALYGTIVSTFNTALKPYNIDAELGSRQLAVVWLAVAFSLAAGLFWLFSVCCCSGRSPHHQSRRDRRRSSAENKAYNYERVASPFGQRQPHQEHHGQNSYEMSQPQYGPGSSYEPYRHENRV